VVRIGVFTRTGKIESSRHQLIISKGKFGLTAERIRDRLVICVKGGEL